ncbi:MAG: DUF3857 domain-containing protein [Pyrinomonadaceae bacterium]
MKAIVSIFAYSLLLLFATSPTVAQDKDWKPISPDDLAAKAPIVEPDADAEAIFWETRIDDSGNFDLSIRHYVRVKIFTERGREKYSKFDIPFSKGEKIKDLAARVIKADGSIVDIKKEDIFEREIVKANGLKVKAKSFAIPNIEPGVIVEYRYKEQIEDAGASGMRIEFQRDIPVRRMAYYYKPYQGEPTFKTYNFKDVKFIKDKDGYYLASKTNVQSFKQEPYMPPEDMARPWMRLGRGQISLTGILFKTELAKYLKKDGGDMKKIAAEIAAGATTDEEKVKKFYEYCQSQIANTTWDPTITDEMRKKLPENKGPKDVMKRKTGTAFDIDTLFGSLAISSGMDARIAFIGNRSKMFTNVGNIDQDFLRPAAIGVKVDGRWKFYNPGMKFLPFGKLVWYEEDSAAEVVSEKHLEWIQTPLSDHEFSITKRMGKFKLLEDGSLEGDVTVELNGQQAINYRIDNFDETPTKLEEQLIDDIKRQMSTAEVSAITIENLTDGNKPLVQRYKVRVPNYAQKTGKRLFLQPNFFEYGNPAVFSSSTRKYDIYFQYPWSENDNIEIIWPTGFELDNADAPGVIADAAKIGMLDARINVDKVNRLLMFKRKFHFGGGGNILFGSATYTPLKGLFDAFHKADSHTITLRQK